MKIIFYTIIDEKNSFPKKLDRASVEQEYNGNLRDECDILNPIITILGQISIIRNYNYCYIEDFGRYYFIEDINVIRSKQNSTLIELKMHVDVLQSYYTRIMDIKAIITRTEMMYDTLGNSVADLMIVDSKWTSKPKVIETYIGYDDSDNSVHDGKNTFAHYSVSDNKYNFVMTVGGLPYGS